MFKAQHTFITPVVGYNFKTAPKGGFLVYIQNISFTSYQVPIYTPGWRVAMWMKCLAKRQKCQALMGIEPATL